MSNWFRPCYVRNVRLGASPRNSSFRECVTLKLPTAAHHFRPFAFYESMTQALAVTGRRNR